MKSNLEPTKYRGIRKVIGSDGTIRGYRVVFDVEPGRNGKRKQATRTVKTLKEAKDLHERASVAVRDQSYIAPSLTTVDEHLTSWLKGMRELRPSSRCSYENALKPVKDAFGSRPLQHLRRVDVEALVSDMLATGGRSGNGRSVRTVKITLVVLGQALDRAVADKLIPVNPAYKIRLPQRQAPAKKAWSAAQLATFLASVEDERLAAGWRLSASGLRRGEVLGLRWADVDIDGDRPVINVRQARVLTTTGRVEVGLPKSERSRRTLPIQDATLIAQLRALRKLQREESMARGGGGRLPEYVVSDEVGRPVRPERWSKTFIQLAKAAELPELHLHGLRHSALSALHLAGVPVATISRWAGHASPSFTMSVYVETNDDAMTDAAEVLGRALSGAV